MKYFVAVLFIAQAALLQTAYSQVIRSCGCGPNLIAPPVSLAPSVAYSPVVAAPLVPSSSVAANLADTLSLLTVSSLLADTLPLGYTNVVGVPSLPVGCGCGYGGLIY